MSAAPAEPGSGGAPLLLEVEGMKCGGCVRAVEQRLAQRQGVRQVSVNLLTRTAWVEVDRPADRLEDLLQALRGLGFEARQRQEDEAPAALRDRLSEQHWWQRWRGLMVALSLLLVSGLAHLAEAGALPALAAPLQRPWLHALVATAALAGPGRSILVNGWRSALAGMPGMDTLVGLGVASSYLASLVGWLWPASGWACFFNEAVMLLGFVLLGRFLEARARYRTGRAIAALARLQPEQALLVVGEGSVRPVRVGGLRPGDRIRILPGDRIPVDGRVRSGSSTLDTSCLTGEAMPRETGEGSELAAGCLNLTGPLELEVLRRGGESAIARIVQLVEQAQLRKAPIQGLADQIAGRFCLGVVALALATFLFWWLLGAALWPAVLTAGAAAGHAASPHGHGLPAVASTPLQLALQLAIAVLVVACPCALGLATPAAISVGTGAAARRGLLFRGGDAIEMAAQLRSVLFDKTGTLTLGRPLVRQLEPVAGAPAGAAERMLQLAASLERDSRHPLAHALLQEAEARSLALLNLEGSRAVAGEGLEAQLPAPADTGRAATADPGNPAAPAAWVRVGRLSWLESRGVQVPEACRARHRQLEADGATVLAVALAERLLGLIAVEDSPRPDAAAMLEALRRRHLAIGLLSGDQEAAVRRLAQRVGLAEPEIAWDLRPEQKLERLLREQKHGPVAMVGDGINDAPALAAADLGIAVGTGTQIALESADLVVMGDRLAGLPLALELASRTMAKVRQNLVWAFGYNLIALPIAAGALLPGLGMRLSPPLAALLMALSSITVVANALLLQDGIPRSAERQG